MDEYLPFCRMVANVAKDSTTAQVEGTPPGLLTTEAGDIAIIPTGDL